MKLNLGCGRDYKEGWINVDKYDSGDIVWNLNVTPYPFPDDSAESILLDNVLEHIENVHSLLEECYRILKPGGSCRIIVPYYNSAGAYNDITHVHFFNHTSIKQLFEGESRGVHRNNTDFSILIKDKCGFVGRLIPFTGLRHQVAQIIGNTILELDIEAIKEVRV